MGIIRHNALHEPWVWSRFSGAAPREGTDDSELVASCLGDAMAS